MNWNSRRVNQVTLAVVAAGTIVGGICYAAGYPGAADAAWAASTAFALIPLSASVISGLRASEFGVDIIALLAMVGALVLGQYLAGAVIALMLAGGQALEHFAESRARRELSALLNRSPQFAHRWDGAALTTIPVGEVRLGDSLLVKPGEVIPVDGVVTGTAAVLDESALTGEAVPVQRRPGEKVRSGAVNSAREPVTMRATALAEDSTYAGIIRLVQQAQASKAPMLRLADRYSMIFLPVTLAVAGLAWALSGEAVRALAVLVVATPCPLILAAPVAIVSGISRAARRGIIVKGGGALETIARATILLLDKTGTVTGGSPVITDVETFGHHSPDEILRLAASLDQVSPHVLAGPIVKAAVDRGFALSFPEDVQEEFGSGVRGTVDGRSVRLGRASWVLEGEPAPAALGRVLRRTSYEGSSSVIVAIDDEVAGALLLEDPVRPDSPLAIRALREGGFRKIVLLTGDHEEVANVVGEAVGVDTVLAQRSPAEKVEAVKTALREGVTVMVGDGINDAPALAAADVGVALGARGATASSEAADIVLLVDRLDRLLDAVQIARRSRSIAIESILAGMALSFAGMGVAAFGFLPPVWGALTQEAIDVLVILNALRALQTGRKPGRADAERAELTEKIKSEHQRLLPGIRRIRELADRLDTMPPVERRNELEQICGFLESEIVPHGRSEDAVMYPVVAEVIGGRDPTAPMSRSHLEIAHLTSLLRRTVNDLPESADQEDTEDIRDLRRILYSLYAILMLHVAQEEESYLALLDQRYGGRESAAAGRRG